MYITTLEPSPVTVKSRSFEGVDRKMHKTNHKAIWFLFITFVLLIILVCYQKSAKEDPIVTSTENPTHDLFYDYDLIYTYRDTPYNTEDFRKLAELLQSLDMLKVKGTNFMDGEGILQINYGLNLTEAEPDYKINFTKQMQDAIVLFAVFDYIQGIEFNYTQADYCFGGVPIMRAQAESLLGEQIAPFGNTQEDFAGDFPYKVQAVVWEPNVMDRVNYYHVMGLDE